MHLFNPPVRLISRRSGKDFSQAGILLLALALVGPGLPCAGQSGDASGLGHPVVLTTEQVDEWRVLPWFGYYMDFSPWIYHVEHGWQHVVGTLAGGFHVYDARLGAWGWSSDRQYPWIYWYAPVRSWTWYWRGGSPGWRWFHLANDGGWRPESELAHGHWMVPVAGGSLLLSSGMAEVAGFEIGRHELTWGEWQEIRAWGAANGYDIGGVGAGCADDHPVRGLNWYDALKGCNAKSEMEGMMPVYSVDGLFYRSGQVVPAMNPWGSGYRLPFETEWEYAARGGNRSQDFTYSGSDNLDAVGWYADNNDGAACNLWNGRGTWPVGQKAANELGLHDMSGNLWEWCWDAAGPDRRVRGGSVTTTTAQGCSVFSRGQNNPADRFGSDGLRLARSNNWALSGFVRIAPGTFTMGSPEDEPGRYSNETRHTVILTRAFFLQQTEVTKAQWDAVAVQGPGRGYTDLPVGHNGFNGDGSGMHPVTEVSWYDVMKWLNLKSELEALSPCYWVGGAIMRTGEATPTCDFSANGYRLPTEAEWEYACRAGTTTAFHSGPITYLYDSPLGPNLDPIGWYAGNSSMNTHPVGQKHPNAWGLHDMSGNVFEWCWDWFGTYPGTVSNPAGPASGLDRLIRGGGYSFPAHYCRSANRKSSIPDERSFFIGFRPALNGFPID